MQDIIPPKKRSIRDIPLPDGKLQARPDIRPERREIFEEQFEAPQIKREVREIQRNFSPEPEEEIEETEESESEFVSHLPPARSRRSSSSMDSRKPFGKKKIAFFSVLIFAFIFVVFLVSRESAKVYIYAKEMTQSANVSLALNYTPLELSLEKVVSVKATGEEQVTQKATGKITIYNEYEEEEQRLLKETRFESSNGLIYRIPTSVVVPGLTRDSSGNVVPGKLEVEVVADKAGEEYNIGAGKFTVPGFKDLPQYDSFYAVSEKPIEGGFDGIRKVISESDREQAENSLKTQLKDELIKMAQSKTTPESLVLANESMIVYEILGDKVEGNNVSVTARGTIKAVSFNSKEFSNSIARSLFSVTDEENISISNIPDLDVTVSRTEENNRATVDVSGNISFLWINDAEMLKEKLAGTEKETIDDTVQMFPGIDKISAEIMPFWSSTIPEDVSKIKIIDSKN
jgi:hypothetical protein